MRHRAQTVSQTRIKLAPENEGDKQQLQSFCDACKGIPQATRPAFTQDLGPSTARPTAPPDETLESAMTIYASTVQSSMTNTPPSEPSGPTTWTNPESPPLPFSTPSKASEVFNDNILAIQAPESGPSGPPVIEEMVDDGPVRYPSVELSPVDMISRHDEEIPGGSGEMKGDGDSLCCVICLDARVEGACIPCGHMEGCMACLNEDKAKKWGCPVCRAKINQVVKLYSV